MTKHGTVPIVGGGMALLPISLVKDVGLLGTWKAKVETVQGSESSQLSRTLLSSPQGQAPPAGKVDAHPGGLCGLKANPHWCRTLHCQLLSPLAAFLGILLKCQLPPTHLALCSSE